MTMLHCTVQHRVLLGSHFRNSFPSIVKSVLNYRLNNVVLSNKIFLFQFFLFSRFVWCGALSVTECLRELR